MTLPRFKSLAAIPIFIRSKQMGL